MRMHKGCFAVLMAGLISAPMAWAHEGHDHGAEAKVMGTISAVDAKKSHVEVKAKDGKTIGFTVDDKTKYLRGTAAASLADLKVGDRVVVEVSGEGDEKIATSIKLSPAKAPASNAKPAGEQKPQH